MCLCTILFFSFQPSDISRVLSSRARREEAMACDVRSHAHAHKHTDNANSQSNFERQVKMFVAIYEMNFVISHERAQFLLKLKQLK